MQGPARITVISNCIRFQVLFDNMPVSSGPAPGEFDAVHGVWRLSEPASR
jgi:hypothetical protein